MILKPKDRLEWLAMRQKVGIDGKEKETLKQNIRNIIHDIEQRIGKE